MVTEPGGSDFLHGSSLQGTPMLFSLIHTEIGSCSQHMLEHLSVVDLFNLCSVTIILP